MPDVACDGLDARSFHQPRRAVWLAIEISGQGAKDIVDSLYPDAKVSCSGEPGERLRRKGQVWCAFSPANGYRCFIGFNLETGESIAGASC